MNNLTGRFWYETRNEDDGVAAALRLRRVTKSQSKSGRPLREAHLWPIPALLVAHVPQRVRIAPRALKSSQIWAFKLFMLLTYRLSARSEKPREFSGADMSEGHRG